MRVRVLEEIPDDPQLAAAWNDLVLRMERPEVFYTYQWARAASWAFAAGTRTLLFLAYEADRLCGVAALGVNPTSSAQGAFFLTASTADYCDILSEPAMRGAVMAAIFAELPGFGVHDLVLANVPSDSGTLRDLPRIARSHGFHFHERPAYDCGVILFGGAPERQDLLQFVKRKERENRGLKKMAQMGRVQVAHLTTEPSERDLAPIFSAQIVRFLATQRISPLVYRERRNFLTELSRLLGRAGWLKISRLEVSGEALAWNYGFRFHDSWFWYLPTFQLQSEHLSPGSCLLQLLIQEGCSDPAVKRLDLGLGDESYKRRFANSAYATRHVELSRRSTRHMAKAGRHLLVSSVQKSPELEKQLRKNRDQLRSLQKRLHETGLAATVGHALGRAVHKVNAEDEVLLFEAPPLHVVGDENIRLVPMDWKQFADAAIEHAEDSQTLLYLLRSAERLRRGGLPGYVLQRGDGPSLHFLWIGDVDGFHLAEIDHRLESGDGVAAMIFDCWTPVAHRAKGYYSVAIQLAAASLQRQDRQAWIFSAATNHSSTRGIVKAGFVYRYSLVRKRRWGRSTVTRLEGTRARVSE